MFPVWDFVVDVFPCKEMLNMGWVLSIPVISIYIISKLIECKEGVNYIRLWYLDGAELLITYYIQFYTLD